LHSYIDEYTRVKSQPIKTKKRPKKRPQSASAAGNESVRLNLLILYIYVVGQSKYQAKLGFA